METSLVSGTRSPGYAPVVERAEKRKEKRVRVALEIKFERKLYLPGIVCRCRDDASRRSIGYRIRDSERRGIRNVKKLSAKLQKTGFGYWEFFEHRYIEITQPLRAQNIRSAIAVGIRCRKRKCAGAATRASRIRGYEEPASWSPDDHGHSYDIGPLTADAGVGDISRYSRRERLAASENRNALHSPTSQESLRQGSGIAQKPFPSTYRKLVTHVESNVLRDVEGRERSLEIKIAAGRWSILNANAFRIRIRKQEPDSRSVALFRLHL